MMIDDRREVIDSEEKLKKAVERIKNAQKAFAEYTQEQVDKIFYEASLAACKARLELARLAFEETGMGVAEDKVIKNHYASEYIYNAFKDVKTCGVIDRDEALGVERIAEPLGVIAAIIPTTNPTSTAIFKALICLKTRNAIIFSPHPRAKRSTAAAARIVLDAAVKAGAPEGIIDWVDEPSIELTNALMKQVDVILATGGQAMVRSAYSSGRPALGVGSGNTPVIIDESADITLAASSVIHSKTFDNGMICASEQSLIVLNAVYDKVKDELLTRGCYFLNEDELERVRQIMFKKGKLNSEIVGQSALKIAELAGISIPEGAKVLIGEVSSLDSSSEPFAGEKLSPILALYRAHDFSDALSMAERLIAHGGYGHTASLYIDPDGQKQRLEEFNLRMKACRIVINTPSAQGAIGDIYNHGLTPSLTLGCGSWGGNSICENVGVKHLLNIKTVAQRRDNMLWFRVPERVFINRGCLDFALCELKRQNKKRAFIVTDKNLIGIGYVSRIDEILAKQNIERDIFCDVNPDPTFGEVKRGAAQMLAFSPDAVIALGGGSVIDAAKIMWLLYEHPDADFDNMAMRFADIRKRIYEFPEMGKKASFTAIPTTAGTGSEVTPFAVITDENTGVKYPLADYALMPNVAIIDAELMKSIPKQLTAAAGIDALTHAIEAYASMLASDYTDPMALHAIKLIFEYLPRAYEKGEADMEAREKMADAATLAGMAFANAFLGICHSMAHKLGAFFHLPHGIANALLIEEVMRFNSSEAPLKMGTFPKYAYPHTLQRYAEIAEHIGIREGSDEEKFDSLIQRISEIKQRVGIKASIREYGISEREFLERLDEMTEQAFDDQCTGANPRFPLISEIRQIYLDAYYSKS